MPPRPLGPRGAMASRLAALGHDDVHAGALHRARVRDGRHHDHHLDAALVRAADLLGARLTEADRPHGDALLDDDLERGVDQVGHRRRAGGRRRQPQSRAEAVESGLHLGHRGLGDRGGVGGRPQRVGHELVDAEGAVGGGPHAPDRVAHLVGREVQRRDDAEAAGPGHLGDQVGAGDAAHPRLHDRMLDTQQVAQRRAKLHRPISFSACSRSFPRCTLSPCGLGVRGTSLTKRTIFGILNEAILPWQNARSASSVSRAWGFRMT
jgi:hypothetical protein